MKYFRILLFAVIAALAVACVEEPYSQGEPDSLDCQFFYFPAQTAEYMLAPTDKKYLDFQAARQMDYGDIVVPFELQCSEDGIFEVDEDAIAFDDSRTTTKFRVKFPNAEVGKKYTCTIKVTDPAYISQYALESTELSFSIIIVKWNELDGMAKWRDDMFTTYALARRAELVSPYHETEVKVYERDDMPGYYRFDKVYTPEYISTIYAGDASMAEDLKDYCKATSIYVNATDPKKVYLDLQYAFDDPFFNSSYGDMYIGSDVQEVWNQDYSNLYGTLEDKVITFPKNSIIIYIPNIGTGIYGNTEGMFRIVLPGGVARDHSFKVKAGVSEQGVLPLTFTLGTNVTKVKYQVYEGRVNEVDMLDKIEEVKASGKVKEVTSSGSFDFTAKESGFYTLVACAYDETEYIGFESVQFGYDTKEDSRNVDIHLGLIVSDKYTNDGMTSENSMEYYVYGKDITKAKLALYKKSQYEDFKSDIQEREFEISIQALTGEELNMLNTSVHSGVIGNLNAGTEYVLVVYAENGYHSGFFELSESTKGEYNPLDVIYNSYDIPEKYQFKKKDNYMGDWEMWSADPFHTPWVRKNRGIVTFKDKKDVYYDKDGKEVSNPAMATDTLDYITLTGLYPETAAANSSTFKDVSDFEFYRGFVYTLVTSPDQLGTVTTEDGATGYATNVYLYFGENQLDAGIQNGAMVGGFTSEGTLPLVANPVRYPEWIAITLCYFTSPDGTGDGKIIEEGHAYPLLARPGTMDKYTGKGTEKVVAASRKVISAFSGERRNHVETERGYMKSTIDMVIASSPYDYMNDAVMTDGVFSNDIADYSVSRHSANDRSFNSVNGVLEGIKRKL